jgi:hypothetical protein
LANTAPLASFKTTQLDSTPSEMVPVSSVVLPLALEEPLDGLFVLAEPDVPSGRAAVLDDPFAVPVEGDDDAPRLEDDEEGAGGVDGTEEPQAARPKVNNGQQRTIMARRTVSWVRLVDADNFFTRRTLDDRRSRCLVRKTIKAMTSGQTWRGVSGSRGSPTSAGDAQASSFRKAEMGTIEDVRELASVLPRSVEAIVRDRVKFRVGRIVYIAFSRDESMMGFAFPKEERDSMIASEPTRYVLPATGDLRYNWLELRLETFGRVELHEIVLDAWRMVVPKSVATAYEKGNSPDFRR